jgi:hypothetical protein
MLTRLGHPGGSDMQFDRQEVWPGAKRYERVVECLWRVRVAGRDRL